MKTLAAGPRGVFDAGKEYDMPDDLGRQFEEFWAGGKPAPAPKGKKPAAPAVKEPAVDPNQPKG